MVEGGLRMLGESLGYRVMPNESCSDKGSAVMELMDVNREMGLLAECLQAAIEDGELRDDEKRAISSQTDRLVTQALELKDAIQRGLK